MNAIKKVLINGAYGGVGTDLSEYLAEKEFEVVKSSPEIDINNREAVFREMADVKPDIVIHLAAMVGTKDCEEIPEQAIKTNVYGTHNVASAAKQYGAKFVYFSTTAIYKPGIEPILEDSETGPYTIYGKTKHWGELVAKEVMPKNDLLIVRPCFGFGGKTDVSILGALIKSHYTKKYLNILLDMKKRKDYTHVRNISHAVYLMLKNDAFGNDYNVSYGNAIEYGEVIRLLETHGIFPYYFNFPERDYMGNHCVDNSKLVRDFGYKPLISLEDGVKMVVDRHNVSLPQEPMPER